MKTIILTLLIIYPLCFAWSQDCTQNLTEARSAYINGDFEKVNALLSTCYDLQLSGLDKKEALELLINANLLLEERQIADAYMKKLLAAFPLTEKRPSDLLRYQRLFDSYSIWTKWNVGIRGGINQTSYSVLQYRSLSALTEEPESYSGEIGASIGLVAEYFIKNKYFLTTGIFYHRHTYNQQEFILNFQDLSITERLDILQVPIGIGYKLNIKNWAFVVNGGIAANILTRARADIELFGRDPEFRTPLTGLPRKTEGFNTNEQRKTLTTMIYGGAGIRRKFGLLSLEFSCNYGIGLNNLNQREERYSNEELIETYSYVSDDFKMDVLSFNVGLIKSIVYPNKK